MTDAKRKKTTNEQRQIMLQFMEEHPDLAQNRLQGLDARKRSTALWEELATLLNCCGNGTTKTTDKWIKSWRDWRVDTKSKAAKLKNYQRGTGGGGPSPAALLEVEERLISLIGIESVMGHSNVIDPAEPQNWTEHQSVTSIPQPVQCEDTVLPSQFPSAIPCKPSMHSYSSTVPSMPSSVDSSIYHSQQQISLSSHSPPLSSSFSSIHLHPCTHSKNNLSSASHEAMVPRQTEYKAKRLRKQKLAEDRDIDVQILGEMQAQTNILQTLTEAVTDIAASIRRLIDENLVSPNTNLEDAEMVYEDTSTI